uniref:hypothetical protein n=1 Tax=Bacteroides fragilis TaxID=817 RepID=UPI003563A336
MAELELYEYEQLDPKWDNKHCIPYYNPHINKFYAKAIYDGNIVKRSYSDTLRELRRKMRNYH